MVRSQRVWTVNFQEDCVELLGCEDGGELGLGENSAAVVMVHSKGLRAVFCICWYLCSTYHVSAGFSPSFPLFGKLSL